MASTDTNGNPMGLDLLDGLGLRVSCIITVTRLVADAALDTSASIAVIVRIAYLGTFYDADFLCKQSSHRQYFRS